MSQLRTRPSKATLLLQTLDTPRPQYGQLMKIMDARHWFIITKISGIHSL